MRWPWQRQPEIPEFELHRRDPDVAFGERERGRGQDGAGNRGAGAVCSALRGCAVELRDHGAVDRDAGARCELAGVRGV